jgi:hypothetical protein
MDMPSFVFLLSLPLLFYSPLPSRESTVEVQGARQNSTNEVTVATVPPTMREDDQHRTPGLFFRTGWALNWSSKKQKNEKMNEKTRKTQKSKMEQSIQKKKRKRRLHTRTPKESRF